MQTFIAAIMAIITYVVSLFSSIPALINNIKSKPDYSWLITSGETVEHSYDEYYEFYHENLVYSSGKYKDVSALRDVTAQYQALLDKNLEIAKKWRETPGAGQIEFYNHVKDGGVWDYKLAKNHKELAEEWGLGLNDSFSIYGMEMDWEAFGNINFAFTGGATGFTPTTLMTGGGIVEAKHRGIEWKYLPYFCDYDEDHDLILFGLELYSYVDPSYKEQARTIDTFLDVADPRIVMLCAKIYEETKKDK